MRDILFYINAAMQKSQCSSERRLCEMLQISGNSISSYRNKNVLPTDDTMIKLAKIAGIDPWIALLDLSIWRTDGAAQDAWKALSERIKAAVFILVTAGFFASASPALASGKYSQNIPITKGEYVADMERYCILWEIIYWDIREPEIL